MSWMNSHVYLQLLHHSSGGHSLVSNTSGKTCMEYGRETMTLHSWHISWPPCFQGYLESHHGNSPKWHCTKMDSHWKFCSWYWWLSYCIITKCISETINPIHRRPRILALLLCKTIAIKPINVLFPSISLMVYSGSGCSSFWSLVLIAFLLRVKWCSSGDNDITVSL